MNPTIPLEQMSVEAKIELMERTWDDLCHQASGAPVPDWHGEVLAQREQAAARGEDAAEDWDTAKARIRKQLP